MKYGILVSLALTGGLTAQAHAGVRGDVHLGWDHPSIHVLASDGTDSGSATVSEDGLIYGAELGYDMRMSTFSLGVYGGYDSASTRQCEEVYGGDEACIKAGRNWSAGVRAGYFFSGNMLIYVKGGYSNGSVKLSYRDPLDPTYDFAGSEDMDGFHIGAGIQLDVTHNVYAKLEYVRTDYKDYDYRDGSFGLRAGIDRDNLTYGMGFRF